MSRRQRSGSLQRPLLPYGKQNFLNLGWLVTPRTSLEGSSEKIKSLEKTRDAQLKVFFPDLQVPDLQVVHVQPFRALGQNYFPFRENFCAKSIMPWQVNSGYDTSYAVAYQ
jgi:hypothetical protein